MNAARGATENAYANGAAFIIEAASVLSATLTETEPETKTRVAPRWKVILHNDNVTTFAFVIELLIRLFHKPHTEAMRLTNLVHHTGLAVVEVTSRERAELYVEQVRSLARPRGYPLTATIEPE